MRFYFLLITLLFLWCANAQPFRYINGNEYDRDSIQLLKIAGYKEYVSQVNSSDEKQLVTIVEYDTNGNLTRHWRYDLATGYQNQMTYVHSPENYLLEQSTYSPDSLTPFQRIFYVRDSVGNELECKSQFYKDGLVVSESKVVHAYDAENRCIEIIGYGVDGQENSHYQYRYNQPGIKTELVIARDGSILYERQIENRVYEEPIGFPQDRDAETEALFVTTISYNSVDGGYTTEDGFEIRKFDARNILLYRLQKKYREHWYYYTFY